MWKEYTELKEEKDGLNGGVQFIKVYRLQWKGKGRQIETDRSAKDATALQPWGVVRKQRGSDISRHLDCRLRIPRHMSSLTLDDWWSIYDSEGFLFVSDCNNVTHKIKVFYDIKVRKAFWRQILTLGIGQWAAWHSGHFTLRYRAPSTSVPKVHANRYTLRIIKCLFFSVWFSGAVNVHYRVI
jgi:hypothetical protein